MAMSPAFSFVLSEGADKALLPFAAAEIRKVRMKT